MKFGLIFIGMMGAGVAGMAQSDANSMQIDQAIQDMVSNVAGNGTSRAYGTFVNFHTKEDTKGSRYMFPDWMNGAVTTKTGVVISKDSLLYNYDKISHNLFLTDRKTVVQVDGENIKSFTFSGGGRPMTFVRLESVRPNAFFQQLVDPGTSGSGYGLYKLTKTTFKKADFHTDGMVESGNNYDEYVDEAEYYVVMPDGKTIKKVELKKKSIREALADAKLKTDDFFNAHRNEDINENFLMGLVNSLNH